MNELIYIAEDDQNIRKLEKAFLEKNDFRVLTFENGDELYDEFQTNPADLLVLDIMMPGTDGLTLCSKIRQSSNVPIVIVSAKGSDIERVAGITMGCDDYLSKPFSPIELVARVQAIFRRMEMSTPKQETEILKCGDLEINIPRLQVTKDNEIIDLTANEFNLLTYLAQNSERAVSRNELLQKVWNFGHEEIDTRATDDTMKRLRKKLNDCNSNVVIETVRGFGFRIG